MKILQIIDLFIGKRPKRPKIQGNPYISFILQIDLISKMNVLEKVSSEKGHPVPSGLEPATSLM